PPPVALWATVHNSTGFGLQQSEEDSGKSIGKDYRFRGVPIARTRWVPSARIRGCQPPERWVPTARGQLSLSTRMQVAAPRESGQPILNGTIRPDNSFRRDFVAVSRLEMGVPSARTPSAIAPVR